MSPGHPDHHADAWPRITVVIPSFNQAEFLEAALASIADQNYPNLELIVLDGGSTDGSVDIIRRFEGLIDQWRSHRDAGQAAALHEGFSKATGEILGWLNSDDLFEPGALINVAKAWQRHGGGLMITGGCRRVGGWWDGETHYPTFQSGFDTRQALPVEQLLDVPFRWMTGDFFFQPEVFFPADLYHALGGVDASIDYAMDYDLWIRMGLAGAEIVVLDTPLAAYRVHPDQKTTNLEATLEDTARVANRHLETAGLDHPKGERLRNRNRRAYQLRLVAKVVRAKRLLVTKITRGR
jgi:glycosyltransferase involved in cell wall biosynthesis